MYSRATSESSEGEERGWDRMRRSKEENATRGPRGGIPLPRKHETYLLDIGPVRKKGTDLKFLIHLLSVPQRRRRREVGGGRGEGGGGGDGGGGGEGKGEGGKREGGERRVDGERARRTFFSRIEVPTIRRSPRAAHPLFSPLTPTKPPRVSSVVLHYPHYC
ncbi:hypothetical protein V1477_012822 [Vespula maculifrons]|uniref:Uncharacterized protein n=1 Tax=Vespula maculifrons TaxID=7453 RepID=A0ABD2BU62_VESMC